MNKNIIVLLLALVTAFNGIGQDNKVRLKNWTVIPKIGASRSVGLSDLNDELAWFGYNKLPIISTTAGFEVNAQLGNFGFGIDYQVFGYTTEIADVLNPNSGSPSTSIIRGSDLSLTVGFDLIKNERYRFEPVLGIGYRTTNFTMLLRDTSMTFNQVLGGSTNAYTETDKLGFLLSPGIRFMEHTPKGMDYNVEVGFRWMASQFNWDAHNLPILSLSGINVRLGVVINLSELVGGGNEKPESGDL